MPAPPSLHRGGGPERLLTTVLFTDIVGSTERAAQLGDRGWKELVARHHAIVRQELRAFRGRELDTAGDGFFAIFERPAQAIECATSIIDRLAPLDIRIRAAIHMGEAEVMGEKVGGITVHVASRALAVAAPGEILVTRTVREVAAGADVTFSDRGVHEFKGVPEEWDLYAVEWRRNERPTEKVPILIGLGFGGGSAQPVLVLFDGRLTVDVPPDTYNFTMVGATPEQLRKWGYEVTEVPNVDARVEACLPLVGAAQFQCWASLDQYLMENVVPWVPYAEVRFAHLGSPRVVSYSFDAFTNLPALDRIAVQP